jgi:ATP-binding cassette subfamily B protein
VLAAFLLYLRRFFEPMQDVAQFYNTFQSATPALEKLSGVLEERRRSPSRTRPGAAAGTPRGELLRRRPVRLRRRRPVLPDLDLDIPAGQTVALVGATGAGKSTLARLARGSTTRRRRAGPLDGVDLRRLADADLRRAVVMVTQENFLFSGTVADNIASAGPTRRPGGDRGGGPAIGAHDFIAALPEGYDTDVASAAAGCRPGSASWSRSPARSSPTRRC